MDDKFKELLNELEEKLRGSNMDDVERESKFGEIKERIGSIFDELERKRINQSGLRESIEELGNNVVALEGILQQNRIDSLQEFLRRKEDIESYEEFQSEKDIDYYNNRIVSLSKIREDINTGKDIAIKKYKELKAKVEECIQKINEIRESSNEYDEFGRLLTVKLREINESIGELEQSEEERHESISESMTEMESALTRNAFELESYEQVKRESEGLEISKAELNELKMKIAFGEEPKGEVGMYDLRKCIVDSKTGKVIKPGVKISEKAFENLSSGIAYKVRYYKDDHTYCCVTPEEDKELQKKEDKELKKEGEGSKEKGDSKDSEWESPFRG